MFTLKKIFLIFLLILIITSGLALKKAFAQELFPGVYELKASTMSINYGETVNLTFRLGNGWGRDTEFFVTIPRSDRGSYEVIGQDRWHGVLKSGEVRVLNFTIKPKSLRKLLTARIRTSLIDFNTEGVVKSVNIKINNFDKLLKTTTKSSVQNASSTIAWQSEPLDCQATLCPFVPQNIEGLPFFENNLSAIKPIGISTESRNDIQKKDKRTPVTSLSQTQSFTVSGTLTYETTSGAATHMRYYTIKIFGLATAEDDLTLDKVIVEERIKASTTGSFSVSVTESHNFYVVGIFWEAYNNADVNIYTGILTNDATWNGIWPPQQQSLRLIGAATNAFSEPTSGSTVQVDIYWDEANFPFFRRVSNLVSYLEDSYTLAAATSSQQPEKVLFLWNLTDNHSRTYFLGDAFTDGSSAIVIDDIKWDNNGSVAHEYGHNVQFSFQRDRIPEGGGQHTFSRRFNPHLAYAEGWASFFASCVYNATVVGIDLSAGTPYSYSDPLAAFSPETPHWGLEDEGMVGSALWWFKNNVGITNVWNSASGLVVGRHIPYNFPEFLKSLQENGVSIPSSFWSNKASQIHMGTGIEFVPPGGQGLQSAIDNAQHQGLVYVFNGLYTGKFEIDGKSLALFGESPDLTVLQSDVTGSGSVLQIENVPDNSYSQIDGFTIQNGLIGIDAWLDSPIFVSNNILISNVHGVCAISDMMVRNNFFLNNSASGVFVPPSNDTNSEIRIYNNHIENSQNGINFENTNLISGEIWNNLIYSNVVGVKSVINNNGPTSFDNNGVFNNSANYSNFLPDANNITINPLYNSNPNLLRVPTEATYLDGGINIVDFNDRSSAPSYSNSNSFGNLIGLYGGPEAFLIGSEVLLFSEPNQTVSGSITANTVWSSAISVTGAVTVESGVTLTIIPGSRINFNNGVSLTIKGQITSKGTAEYPITFTSADGTPSRSEWGTVYINSSNNTFEHCIIEGSDWGLKFYGTPSATSGNVVKNCTLRKNDQAIRAENTQVDVYDCTIEDNRHAFVFINNTSSTGGIYLDGNTVRNNDRDGIYSINSVVDVFNTVLDNNGLGNVSTYHGVWASSNSDIALGGRVWDESLISTQGLNTIKNNHGAGVYVSSSSMVLLGDRFDVPGPFGFTENSPAVPSSTNYRAGNNSIYNNGTASGTYNNKEVYRAGGTTVQANVNYWGGTPTSSQFYGSVDYANWLWSPPSGTQGPTSVAAASASNEDTHIKQAIISQLKEVIVQTPDSQEAVDALRVIYSFVRTDWQDKLGERNTIFSYLSGLYKAHQNLKLGETAHQLMIVNKMSKEEYADAIRLAEATPTEYSQETKRDNMVHLISLYLRTGQVQKAQNQFSAFKSTYPNNQIYKELLQDMLKSNPNSGLTKTSTGTSSETVESESFKTVSELPTNFALEQNYPNPFNPTTTIRYELPQEAFVNLTVYNLIGQKIRILFEGPQNAGAHALQWDGKNDFGESVSSGVYVVRMMGTASGKQFVQSRKLAFVK